MKPSAHRFAVALGLALAPGCATTSGPGRLDVRLVHLAATTPSAAKIELHPDETGALVKATVEHLDEAQVPEAVRRLAAEKFPGAKVTGYETESYAGEGDLVYEVEVDTAEGRHCEISATAAGALRYTECRLPPAEIPEAVARAVAAVLPGAEIEEAERVAGPALPTEEIRVEAKAGGRLHYLRFDPAGTLTRHGVMIPAEIEVRVK